MDGGENRRILNAREAAATIGIPVSVLRALKKAGLYEVKHIIPGQLGYDNRDIGHFVNTLLAVATRLGRREDGMSDLVSVGATLRGRLCSVEDKVALVNDLLAGRFVVFGAEESSGIDHVCISLQQFQEFLRSRGETQAF